MADLDNIHLAFGAHYSREEGMCLMEAVAYIAGEPHTDRPECVCPVLASFGRAWNDALNDEDRNRLLRPFIRRLIGTRSTPKVEERRAYMAVDWAVRVAAPVWLRAAGIDDEAGVLEALPPLDSAKACRKAMPTIEQVREAAGAAAGAAAGVAAPAAARAAITDAAKVSARAAGGAAAVTAAWVADAAGGADAVRTAAGAAAWDVDVDAAVAAGVAAARDAAWAAPTAAAGVAAGAVARTAAREALRPHVERLQASAVDLYEQMIEIGDAP